MAKSDLEAMRHSAAHVMAAAVQKLFPGVTFDIGPATDEGFYYDFDVDHRFVPEDLPRIEKEMRRIMQAKTPIVRDACVFPPLMPMTPGPW